MQERKRKPVAPSTISLWTGCIDNWLNPLIGEMPLEKVNNAALKQIVAAMQKGGLSAKTINTYTQAVKSVVASAVNEEGEQVFPRKWNHEFVDMPVVKKSKQPPQLFEGNHEWTCELEVSAGADAIHSLRPLQRHGNADRRSPRA
jgi:hypothetical protein